MLSEKDRDIFKTFIILITTKGYKKQRAFLKDHRELLQPQYDAGIVAQIADWTRRTNGTIEDWAGLHKFLLVLRYAASSGGTDEAIDTAFANLFSGFALDIPTWMEDVPEELDALGIESQTAPQRMKLLLDTIRRAEKDADVPPALVAAMFCDLARAVNEHPGLEPSQKYSQAFVACKMALDILSPIYCPVQYALAQTLLGSIYTENTFGEKRVNEEAAIACKLEALRIYTPQDFPVEYAYLLNNLGGTYMQRSTGERKHNLQNALQCYTQAARILTPEMADEAWGNLRVNLGMAYLRLSSEESFSWQEVQNLRTKAIESFQQVLTPQASQALQGQAQINLGDAYSYMNQLENAIKYYQQALTFYRREVDPITWAALQANLGTVYARSPGEQPFADVRKRQRCYDPQKSIVHYKAALEVFTLDIFPEKYRSIQLTLGEMASEEARWPEAQQAYQQAIAAQHELLQRATGITGYDLVLQDEKNVSTKLGLALLRQGQIENAALAIEQGRVRWQNRAFSLSADVASRIDDIELKQQFEQVRAELVQAQKAVDSIDLFHHSGQMRNAMIHDIALCKQKQNQLNGIIATIRAAKAPADFLQDEPNRTTLLQAARSCGVGHAIVYLAATYLGGIAVAVISADEQNATSDRFLALDLPELVYSTIHDLMQILLDSKVIGGYASAQKEHALTMVCQQWPQKTLRLCAETLHMACTSAGIRSTLDEAVQELLSLPHLAAFADRELDTPEWNEVKGVLAIHLQQLFLDVELQRVTTTLASCGMTQLFTWLKQHYVKSLTLIPCGPLAAFPLASVFIDSTHTLADLLQTTTAASASSLLYATITAAERDGVYALGDPWPTRQHLPWGEAEAHTLRKLARNLNFAAVARVQYQATLTWLLEQALPAGRVVCLSCHGALDARKILDSALFLAKGERLLLRDLLYGDAKLQGLRLLILSACQTETFDVGGAYNEVHSLAVGAMHAGSHAVLGALWSINDQATYLLITHFAKEWFPKMESEPPAAALARAQFWLRNATYEDLMHWSATELPRITPAELQEAGAETALALSIDSSQPLPAFPIRDVRYLVEDAQEYIQQFAQLQVNPSQRPYASPFFWSGFQITGW